MTQATEDLEQDIARTRTRLGDTIDRLQGSLSSSDVVDDLVGSRRPDFGNVFDPIVATIRHHPAPVLLMAVGIGWLVYKLVRERQSQRCAPRTMGRGVQTPR